MKKELLSYQVSPSIFLADEPACFEIRGRSPLADLSDGVKYIVDIMPHTYLGRPFPGSYKLSDILSGICRYEVVCEDGCLRLSHTFSGEQKWRIHVFREALAPSFKIDSPDRWQPYLEALELGFKLEVYSLGADLYSKRPYKGDLHLHTTHSDGLEAPAIVAANYRRAGYDFIAMTDHHVYTAAAEANAAYRGISGGFCIYNGEEIHNDDMGNIHIVNFDSDYSVNDLILGETSRPTVLQEVEAIKNESALDGVFDKTDIAWRVWVYRAVKKSGGLAIFPHPYWDICDIEHASPEAIEFTFKNGLMDVFEIFGGVRHNENNLQALLYYDMRAAGYSYPIVGSTDSHSTAEGAEYFKSAYTVAFAENSASARSAIEAGLTVAVQSEPGQEPNIAGGLRLAKYADFLINNYFPLHDERCEAAGHMMLEYLGAEDKDAARIACEAAESRIKALEDRFFG